MQALTQNSYLTRSDEFAHEIFMCGYAVTLSIQVFFQMTSEICLLIYKQMNYCKHSLLSDARLNND